MPKSSGLDQHPVPTGSTTPSLHISKSVLFRSYWSNGCQKRWSTDDLRQSRTDSLLTPSLERLEHTQECLPLRGQQLFGTGWVLRIEAALDDATSSSARAIGQCLAGRLPIRVPSWIATQMAHATRSGPASYGKFKVRKVPRRPLDIADPGQFTPRRGAKVPRAEDSVEGIGPSTLSVRLKVISRMAAA
jgi:hypothetical protein